MAVQANIYTSTEQVTAVVENTNHIVVADSLEQVVDKIIDYLYVLSGNSYKVVDETYQNNHSTLFFKVI